MAQAKIRIHYFNARGRAELTRWILKYAGREFEDVRHAKEDWPNEKSKFPTRQLPTLEVIKDGKSHFLGQSLAIGRSLARKYGLVGVDDIEAAHCDEVVDCVNEMVNIALKAYFETDEERKTAIKQQLKNVEYPRLLGFLERKLKENGGKHIVGKQWTWADFALSIFIRGLLNHAKDAEGVCDKIPTLVALCKSVEEIPAIATWIKARPETPF